MTSATKWRIPPAPLRAFTLRSSRFTRPFVTPLVTPIVNPISDDPLPIATPIVGCGI